MIPTPHHLASVGNSWSRETMLGLALQPPSIVDHRWTGKHCFTSVPQSIVRHRWTRSSLRDYGIQGSAPRGYRGLRRWGRQAPAIPYLRAAAKCCGRRLPQAPPRIESHARSELLMEQKARLPLFITDGTGRTISMFEPLTSD